MDSLFSLLTRKVYLVSIYLDSGDGRSGPRSIRGARSTQAVPARSLQLIRLSIVTDSLLSLVPSPSLLFFYYYTRAYVYLLLRSIF